MKGTFMSCHVQTIKHKWAHQVLLIVIIMPNPVIIMAKWSGYIADTSYTSIPGVLFLCYDTHRVFVMTGSYQFYNQLMVLLALQLQIYDHLESNGGSPLYLHKSSPIWANNGENLEKMSLPGMDTVLIPIKLSQCLPWVPLTGQIQVICDVTDLT